MISKLPKWAADLTERSASIMLEMQILETTDISPDIKKIRFQGDLSRMNFQIGYANLIRVNNTEFRNYTTAYHDTEKGILDIIFHIHGNGVGSRYINTLATGDELCISLPRGKNFYDPGIKQQFLFGDETSLGIACALQPILKKNKHPYQFYFELDEENRNVPELLGLKNCMIFLKNSSFRDKKWIRNLPVFHTSYWSEANFMLTGNAKSVQVFRKVIKEKTSGKIFAQGYWLKGKKGL